MIMFSLLVLSSATLNAQALESPLDSDWLSILLFIDLKAIPAILSLSVVFWEAKNFIVIVLIVCNH